MNNNLSPSFDTHRRWIEDLLTTPAAPHDRTSFQTGLLTENDSPTEHVLRGSKSWAARSFRSRASGNSLRVPSNKENRSTNDAENSRQSSSDLHVLIAVPTLPVLGEIAPNSQVIRPDGPFKVRPSPTPSLKKKKAEAIVKAHGSPQHVRVTAGGRIVPSEQSPLCHPRYGYSAIKTNGGLIKFAPNHPMGKAQWTQATQNGFVAQDVEGRLCQIVNGTILPLNEVDGALRLYIHAPNLNISSRGSSFGLPSQSRFGDSSNQQQRVPSLSKPSLPADPPLPAQTNALELEYSKLEHELRELNKTEALHSRTMAKTAKDALISKRRELVITLDNIRKAIKSIKSAPPPEAPLSPRASKNEQHSTSPPRNRLPGFLRQRPQLSNDMTVPPFQTNFNQFSGMAQVPYPHGQYGEKHTPSPNASMTPDYGMPALFIPPPPFDGSMAPSYAGYIEPTVSAALATQVLQPGAGDTHTAPHQLPQNDGAYSVTDLQKVTSPRLSRAVDIKPPDTKSATALKSSLNPMSPAYKPGAGLLKASGHTDRPAPKSVKDRAPTPLSPMYQLRPSVAANNTARVSDGTISPTKKSPHLHSSSISSFETADFFPRNTREYSTRKYAYPDSEDKENMAPPQSIESSGVLPTTPLSDRGQNHKEKRPMADGYVAPAAPPGNPAGSGRTSDKVNRSEQRSNTSCDGHLLDLNTLPDRKNNNLSPKSKRQDFLFVEEHPSQYTDQSSSSSSKDHVCRGELCVTVSPADQIDFSEASTEWIEGYRAGLARKPVGSDRQGEFLDGYCAGLLKSKPTNNLGLSTGGPTKSISRRPEPAVIPSRSSSRLQVEHREAAPNRPPFETSLQSMDTLKEAVFAPSNENAILTPSADGPHANEIPFNLGAWTKNHEHAGAVEGWVAGNGDGLSGFPFPYRTSSMMERQGFVQSGEIAVKQQTHDASATSADTSMAVRAMSVSSKTSQPDAQLSSTASKSITSGNSHTNGNRVSSLTSIDSNLYRQWPGYRVFSPHLEWKSASSIAQAAGLAAGHFANTQPEGAAPNNAPPARVFSIASNPTMEYHGRFKEGSLDGVTNPPNSPVATSPPMSPSIPPNDSPGKTTKKRDSQSKTPSPAKVKFEHIAEKVGIKVSIGKKDDGAGSPNSPPGKRNWRNVWLGGSGGARKDSSLDGNAV